MQYLFAQVELSAFHILLHAYAPTYAELLFFYSGGKINRKQCDSSDNLWLILNALYFIRFR